MTKLLGKNFTFYCFMLSLHPNLHTKSTILHHHVKAFL